MMKSSMYALISFNKIWMKITTKSDGSKDIFKSLWLKTIMTQKNTIWK